jgi:hypothetical protein
MLDLTQYLFGVSCLLLAVGALALGAVRLRRWLLNGWSGPPALLADSILTLGLLILIAELLGVAGALSRIPLVLAALGLGTGLRLGVPPPAPGGGAPPPAPAAGPWGRRVALAIGSVLVAHWLIGTDAALGTGITNFDSAWYHMPFAAHFAQTGSTLGFDYVAPRYLAWFYPQNSELLHGVGIVLFHRDFLSPLLNLLWLGGCLGAAWCIGRPYGKGPWTVAAAAVLLDAGVMADQAGTARNDTLGIFFLLAALALIVNAAAADREHRPGFGPLAVAGLAVGLAAGTKLSFIGPAAAMLIGAPFLVAAGRRWRALLVFGAPLFAGCGFWFVRNTIHAGNPLPWFKALGPLRLDGPEQGLGGKPQFSALHYAGDGKVWQRWFEPGLSHRLGELWPLLLALALAAVLFCVLRSRPALRLAGLAAAAGVAAYLMDGTSAEGPPGMPNGFASSLRHLLPALFLALVLAPLALDLDRRRARAALAVLLGGLLVSSDLSGTSWRPLYLALAAAAVAVLLGPPLLRRVGPWLKVGITVPRPSLPRRGWAAVAASIVLLAVGGWFVQRSYLSHRYDGRDFRSAGLNAAFAWADGEQQQTIATTVTIQYPLLGDDLSNQVSFLGRRRHDAGFTLIRHCRPWRKALIAGDYRYVVTAGPLDGPAGSGTSHCLAGDPRAKPVVREDKIVVFRLLQRRPDAERRSSGDGRSGGVRPIRRAIANRLPEP